ncbi:unnamed protein product [Linum trigynum]|uniref:Uncharacterized protein n=1 Tax=Linum trigynum TaxID=586398 RepID=A0AAV2EEQ4_9ROSI
MMSSSEKSVYHFSLMIKVVAMALVALLLTASPASSAAAATTRSLFLAPADIPLPVPPPVRPVEDQRVCEDDYGVYDPAPVNKGCSHAPVPHGRRV